MTMTFIYNIILLGLGCAAITDFSSAAVSESIFTSPKVSRSTYAIKKVKDVTTRYIHHTRLVALKQTQDQRKLMDFGPLICRSLNSVLLPEIKSLEDEGITCATMCDENLENIIMECKIPKMECDDLNEFCASDSTFKLIMSIDFTDTTDMSMELATCTTYNKVPGNVNDLKDKRVCISADAEINLGNFLNFDVVPEDSFSITKCSATIDKDDCICETCDNDIGINLRCPGGLFSEQCTNIDMTVETTTMGAVVAGQPEEFSDSMSTIVRFTREVDSATGGLKSSLATATALILLVFLLN